VKPKDVATQYRNELESEFQSAHVGQTRSLNELGYETEEKTKKVAATTLGYAQNPEKKEWFDEECALVCEEENCARARAIQIQRTRAANPIVMNEHKLERRRKKHLFRKKKSHKYLENN
jgi:hypothetical protein